MLVSMFAALATTWCHCLQQLSTYVPPQVAQLVGSALGMVLPSTIVFDYPSIQALADKVHCCLL